MKKNGLFKKLPNLSLLFGNVFILMVMVSLAFIQFSSTHNLKILETELREQILNLATIQNDGLHEAILDYESLINEEVFVNLSFTFSHENHADLYKPIFAVDDLRKSLTIIGLQLDSYSLDLYRSQTILFIAFVILSVILSILLTISELDQMKKYEREKNKRVNDQKLIEVLEDERNLIAVELHDDVAQKLSVISQHFDDSSQIEHSELLKRYNSDVIHKIRTMAHALRSPEFNLGNFQKQLEFLYSDFKSISNIELDATFIGLTVVELNDDHQLHIYRIIQELLTNCRKHSMAKTVKISVLYSHPMLKLHYIDDGVGMVSNENRNSLGLKSIQYRLNILNANMQVSSKKGLDITITIPVGK